MWLLMKARRRHSNMHISTVQYFLMHIRPTTATHPPPSASKDTSKDNLLSAKKTSNSVPRVNALLSAVTGRRAELCRLGIDTEQILIDTNECSNVSCKRLFE